MTRPDPTVTIGMPVYNGEKIVAAAIESALEQSFGDFVLLISDNASTDATQAICEDFARRDPRISYYRQRENLGPIGNFNYLKQACRSDFFVWLACDDRWNPDFLKKTVAVMQQQPECSLVFSNFIVRNLENGSEENVDIKAADMAVAGKRALTRILDMKPSLVYGLQRQSLLKNLNLGAYDFTDVQFSIEAALRGAVVILAERFYIAGTSGNRAPYSLTGGSICRTTFFGKAVKIFFAELAPLKAAVLSLTLSYMLLRHFLVFMLKSLIKPGKSAEESKKC